MNKGSLMQTKLIAAIVACIKSMPTIKHKFSSEITSSIAFKQDNKSVAVIAAAIQHHQKGNNNNG